MPEGICVKLGPGASQSSLDILSICVDFPDPSTPENVISKGRLFMTAMPMANSYLTPGGVLEVLRVNA